MNPTVKAYLQLVRLPNAFTAMADVTAGFLACGGGLGDARSLLGIGAASVFLYSGGIVLNDVCDLAIDRRERPQRPLPSGRISWARARALAIALLGVGVATAALVSVTSAGIGAVLAALIVAYNTWAKSHPVRGPLCMGSCRFANVILGGTAAAAGQLPPWIPALLIGILVIAATVLSRDEVEGGKRHGVVGAAALLVLIAALAAGWLGADGRDPSGWVFLAVFLAFTSPGLLRAWQAPSPAAVQRGIKHLVLGIIPLDAAVAAGAAGLLAGCLVLALLVPSWRIARWIYVT
jgi:hypothetical protein